MYSSFHLILSPVSRSSGRIRYLMSVNFSPSGSDKKIPVIQQMANKIGFRIGKEKKDLFDAIRGRYY